MSKMLAAFLVFVLCCAHAGAARQLPSDLRALIADHRVPLEHLGLYIAPVGEPENAIAINAERGFNPASVIKLLPSLAALELLTPAFQWQTDLYMNGSVSKGALDGDIYIRGGGDPYLTVEAVWAMLKQVRAHGIERIAGDIVVDTGVFELPVFDRAAFDDKPHRIYNGPPDGLMINFWGVRFTVKSHSDGVYINAFPDSPRMKIVNRVKHSSSRCTRSNRHVGHKVTESGDGVVVEFTGVLSSRCPPVILSRAVIPPDRYLAYVVPGLWSDAGGILEGRVRRGAVPDTATRIHSHRSRTLAEVVRATNKFSNNLMARHLLITLGSVYRDRGIEISDGINSLYNWLGSNRIDVPEMNIVNGSGLSRDTRISARGMANVLQAGFRSRYAPEFVASLPVAGEDWALERREFGGPGPRVVRIKTGLIDHVRSMAGFVPSRSGKIYIVVLLINHPGIHQGLGTRMQNTIVRYVMDL